MTDPVIAAADAVVRARDDVENIKRLVGERKVGASALHTAEWTMHQALRNLDRAKEQQRLERLRSNHEPLDAA